jgi:hypothetical protein
VYAPCTYAGVAVAALRATVTSSGAPHEVTRAIAHSESTLPVMFRK